MLRSLMPGLNATVPLLTAEGLVAAISGGAKLHDRLSDLETRLKELEIEKLEAEIALLMGGSGDPASSARLAALEKQLKQCRVDLDELMRNTEEFAELRETVGALMEAVDELRNMLDGAASDGHSAAALAKIRMDVNSILNRLEARPFSEHSGSIVELRADIASIKLQLGSWSENAGALASSVDKLAADTERLASITNSPTDGSVSRRIELLEAEIARLKAKIASLEINSSSSGGGGTFESLSSMLPECEKTELVPTDQTCKCGPRNVICQPLQICHWVYDTCYNQKADASINTTSVLCLLVTLYLLL